MARRVIVLKKLKLFIVLGLCLVLSPLKVQAEDQNVASIGDRYFTSLEDAVDNSKEGDTITLINDIDSTTYLTRDDVLVFEFNKNMTLDLNGHTIKTYNMNYIYAGINLTIKNGIFLTDDAYALFIGDSPDTDNVLIENIKSIGGINVFNATNVTLKNVEAEGHRYYAVWADEHAQINILSGKYGMTDISTATFGIVPNKESFINIYDGEFTAINDKLVLGNGYQKPVIYGGNYNTDPTSYKEENAKVKTNDDGTYTVYYEQVIDIPEFDLDKEVNETEIGISDSDATQKILDETLKDLDIKYTNTKVVINNIKSNPNEEIKNNITDTLNKVYSNAVISNYFDITINVINTDTNKVIDNITNLNQSLKFTVLIPDDLQNKDSNISRKYYIVRVHGDSVDILDTVVSSDGKYASFLSDKFSTYAIAYVDTKVSSEEEIENPATSDNIGNIILVNGMTLIGLIGLGIYYKRKRI